MAVGAEHRDQPAAVSFLERAGASTAVLHVSVEGVQEFLFHRLRRVAKALAVEQTLALMNSVAMHSFDEAVMTRAVELVEVSSIRGRDAVHAATALIAGFGGIVTFDADFGRMAGFDAVHPQEALPTGPE